ncbi:DUF4352 domain-containing protein [Halobacillus sp. GSS1]|uniref:DUF4352 domain-containing protein n=1 Tax=Halobacillus sp. GSS1 TaxID=2815919 RepID=UPI001A8D8309|nr:DUF4352 domain-containing protein [Halobacillus sp. GSS1]MBN9655972.1 DUF4352 domain-containing protein [Halobacillus sp. GSS1]
MKKLLKFVLYAFLAIIVIGGLAAAFGGDGEDTTKENETAEPATAEASDTEDVESKEEESSESEEKSYKIGDTVEVGAMTYTVNGVSTTDQVGPSAFPTEASGKYVVLEVTAKNNGNESVMIDGSYFKLTQGDKTFESDAMASTSANQNEDGTMGDTFFLEQLNPGSELSGKIAFDVAPEIADAAGFSVVAQEGVFGTVSKTIELN